MLIRAFFFATLLSASWNSPINALRYELCGTSEKSDKSVKFVLIFSSGESKYARGFEKINAINGR